MKINVNLKPCNCPSSKRLSGLHDIDCASVPILIPCPIPRSVTVEVVLGECTCAGVRPAPGEPHWAHCPAHPIKVSCSISGETWEASEVAPDWDVRGGALSPSGTPDVVLHACRERWALVKALVLGDDERWRADPTSHGWNLQPQRDAVFSALADMARAEEAAHAAEDRIPRDLRDTARGIHYWHAIVPACRPSAVLFARYVERLIEQVGVLP